MERLYTVKLSEEEFKLYTEFQKEFGLGSDLLHSGVKRTYKKYVGRGRKKLAGEVLRLSEKETQRGIDALKKFQEGKFKKVDNPEANKKLYKRAKKIKARIIGKVDPELAASKGVGPHAFALNKNSNIIESYNDFKNTSDQIKDYRRSGGRSMTYNNREKRLNLRQMKDAEEQLGKTAKGIYNGRYNGVAVASIKRDGAATLAHELGHVGNYAEGGYLTRKIKENYSKGSKAIKEMADINNIYKPRSWKDIIKNTVKGAAVVTEERNATKRGLKYMKKAGYSKGELKAAKEELGAALDTYKGDFRRGIFRNLHSKIQIPSRLNKYHAQQDINKAVERARAGK